MTVNTNSVTYEGHRLKRLLQQCWIGHWQTVHNTLSSVDDFLCLLKHSEVNQSRHVTTEVCAEATGLRKKVCTTEFVLTAKMANAILDAFVPADRIRGKDKGGACRD